MLWYLDSPVSRYICLKEFIGNTPISVTPQGSTALPLRVRGETVHAIVVISFLYAITSDYLSLFQMAILHGSFLPVFSYILFVKDKLL